MNLKKIFNWGPRTQANPRGNRLYDLISQIEFSLLKLLLKRHANSEMDQWERWQMNTKHGDIFIEISRQDDSHNYQKID